MLHGTPEVTHCSLTRAHLLTGFLGLPELDSPARLGSALRGG